MPLPCSFSQSAFLIKTKNTMSFGILEFMVLLEVFNKKKKVRNH